jgi:hypothetical protein
MSRRSKLVKATKTARNLAVADAALALAKQGAAAASPGGRKRRRRRGRLFLAGGAAAAAAVAAGALFKRDKVAGLLPSRSGDTGQDTGWAPAQATGPSNYDVPGPVANTATPVPAPEPQVSETFDERAEEAAAAAEAANIGGPVSDYADIQDPGLAADEADRPLAEAGEGTAEGQEQAEAALADAAQPTAPGISDYERQIDDAIEQASQPSVGEHPEPVEPIGEPAPGDQDGDASEGRTWSGRSINP